MLEKIQSFADGKYDMQRKDVENIYLEQTGDAAEQVDGLGITKRMVSTGELRPFPFAVKVSHQSKRKLCKPIEKAQEAICRPVGRYLIRPNPLSIGRIPYH